MLSKLVNGHTMSYLKLIFYIHYFLLVSHGHVYHIKVEILGLKEGGTTLLYVLGMEGSIRKCWLVVEGVEGQFLVTHGYWIHSQGDGRR